MTSVGKFLSSQCHYWEIFQVVLAIKLGIKLKEAISKVKTLLDVDAFLDDARRARDIFGAIGHHSSQLISYFEGIQNMSKIKDGYNLATWKWKWGLILLRSTRNQI